MKQTSLRAVRESKRLTQEQLESLSGVSQAVISKLETNATTRPAYDIVRKLEAALELAPGTLVFGRQPTEAA